MRVSIQCVNLASSIDVMFFKNAINDKDEEQNVGQTNQIISIWILTNSKYDIIAGKMSAILHKDECIHTIKTNKKILVVVELDKLYMYIDSIKEKQGTTSNIELDDLLYG